ncbi:ABATE domain-containing protein [Streptomyces rectiviolaceus]|uniref:ABATE domain-containing protein n=1 Tax=Streptomyces rectiviolaceus TaxID=332591 RepID=UPI0036390892
MKATMEAVTAEPAPPPPPPPPPAPGAEQYVALDFANSALALSGGKFIDLLGTPAAANRWLTERDLAPAA